MLSFAPLFALATVISGAIASAATPADVCNGLSAYTSSSAVTCIQNTRGKLFEPKALDLCASLIRMSATSTLECVNQVANRRFQEAPLNICTALGAYTASSAIQCASTVADKTFETSTLNVCAGMVRISATSTLNCLAAAGSPLPPPPPQMPSHCPNLREVRSDVDAVLYQTRNGDARYGEFLLQSLKEKLDRCLNQ